jgi:hypothetical protein
MECGGWSCFLIGPRVGSGAFVDNPDRGIMIHDA